MEKWVSILQTHSEVLTVASIVSDFSNFPVEDFETDKKAQSELDEHYRQYSGIF